jgi:hypothetical protein
MTDAAQAVIDAARGVAFCATQWDQPRGQLCAEHLAPLLAALAALDSEPDYRERMARLYKGEDK